MRRLVLATRLLLVAGVLAATWHLLPHPQRAASASELLEKVGAAEDRGLFPSGAHLVPDATTATGWRHPQTGVDGFDTIPLLRATFRRPVRPTEVPASLFSIVPLDGSAGVGVENYLLADDGRTIAGRPSHPLAAGTVYELRVQAAGGERPRATRFVTTTGSGPSLASTTRGVFEVERVLPATTPLEFVHHSEAAGQRRYRSTGATGAITLVQVNGAGRVLVLSPPGEAPQGGWPYVVFAHGLQRDSWRALEVSDGYLRAGFAVVAPVAALAAQPTEVVMSVAGGATSSVLQGSSSTGDEAGRLADEVTAGARRLVRTASVLAGADLGADGRPDLDVAQGFHGESFGGPQAVLAARAVPGSRLVLTSAVGDVPSISAEFAPLRAFLERRLGSGWRQLVLASTPQRGEVAVVDDVTWTAQQRWAEESWGLRAVSPDVTGASIAADRVLVQSSLDDVTVRPSSTRHMAHASGWLSRWWHVERGAAAGVDPHALLSSSRAAQDQAAAFVATGDVVPPGAEVDDRWTSGLPSER